MSAELPQVCLVRHGETAWSLSGQATGPGVSTGPAVTLSPWDCDARRVGPMWICNHK